MLLGDALLGEALVELEPLPLVPDLLPVPAPLVPRFIEGLLGFEVPCVRVEFPDVPGFWPPIPDVDCGLLWPEVAEFILEFDPVEPVSAAPD